MAGLLRKLLGRNGGDNGDGTFSISHAGHSFRLPLPDSTDHILDRMRRRGGFYEADLLMACEQAVAGRDGLCLDIGANVGNHSLFFAGVLGRQTLSFEPVARNRALLEAAVALNPDLQDRVTTVPHALSDAPATLWMAQAMEGNPGTFRVGDETAASVEVRAMPLDDYLAEQGLSDTPVALIKIDVEGHEPAVLRGAEKTLAQNDAVLSLEAANLDEYQAITTLIAPHGYAPAAVYCSTPTVLFTKQADGSAEADVLARIRKHDKKARARR